MNGTLITVTPSQQAFKLGCPAQIRVSHPAPPAQHPVHRKGNQYCTRSVMTKQLNKVHTPQHHPLYLTTSGNHELFNSATIAQITFGSSPLHFYNHHHAFLGYKEEALLEIFLHDI